MGRSVALVTGARQGIGRSIALALADVGFDIAAIDLIEDEKSDSVVSDIQAKNVNAWFGKMDLADIDSHAETIDKAEKALGPIETLINNAGVAVRPLTDILEIGADMFDQNLNVNLRGTFFLTQNIANRMIKRESSNYRSITFITSIAAGFTSMVRSPYCISKCGLSMAAMIFAQRLGEAGISVHEVRPGFIKTDMSGSLPPTKIDDYINTGRVPQRRWGMPADISEVVTTLSTGALPYVTGQPIYVDGGFHIPAG